jgi:hypothetical protein
MFELYSYGYFKDLRRLLVFFSVMYYYYYNVAWEFVNHATKYFRGIGK